MSIIDTSYFIRDISIPNVDSGTRVQDYIDLYEKEVLIDLLGYTLYQEFTTAIAGSPAQKWVDLRDGAEFSFELNGDTINTKWEGLKNTIKKSLIAYYVYYKLVYDGVIQLTGTGAVVSKNENSEVVDATPLMVNAWNNMVALYGYIPEVKYYGESYGFYPYDAYKIFNKHSDTYPFYNELPSAYNFLNANRDDYDNWVFTPKEYLNRFGI